jgi:photosystem II CP47 chlorophyll apoprotein
VNCLFYFVCTERTIKPSLDLPKKIGIHLFLFKVICFGFKTFHIRSLFGPSIWVLDPYGLTGKIQPIVLAWGVKVQKW